MGEMTSVPVVPMVIRGDVIEDALIDFKGRGGSVAFRGPDPHVFVDRLPLASPAAMEDLYTLSVDDILDFLAELGARLDISTNEHMQWARALTYSTSDQTPPLIDNAFERLPLLFERDNVRDVVENTIGVRFLDGWVDTELHDGTVASVRAFGARALHIIPGNGVAGPAATIIRNAFTRSDCILKTPSNNPFGAVAVARTMCELDPQHPLTKHLAVAYWKGGDEYVERRICQPHNVEKIVAWGGFASVKHVAKYVQPGLELISLDPKYSASVVDGAVLDDDAALREVALRIAVDVAAQNQTACCSARVVYVVTGDLADGPETMKRLGALVYDAMLTLPEGMTSNAKAFDPELRANLDAIALQDDWYTVFGAERDEGGVIVSSLPEPVDFASGLADRTCNLVPVDSLDGVVSRIDAYTQTVGVYPEELKLALRDVAPLFGAQRLVSLGYAGFFPGSTPHDGLELERRMCKWIVDLRSPEAPVELSSERPVPAWSPGSVPNTLAAVADPTR